MNFSEIIKENTLLGIKLANKDVVNIKFLSNISINQIKPILEYDLRSLDLNAIVSIGDYDNIIQESNFIPSDNIVIIFWELSNLINSFYYEIEIADHDKFNLYLNKVKNELQLVFENLKNIKLVLFNKFSHLAFTSRSLKVGNFEKLVNTLNSYLEDILPKNFVLVDIDKPLSNTSIELAIDLRSFYSNKTLYSTSFIKNYVNFILPVITSVFGKSKKAIIFDCDNTLWKGIVGEDGIDGICLSENDKNGIFFREIHLLAKYFAMNGIIVGLCSKNNDKDVKEVFESRKDFVIFDSDITIKKVNWNDKATNLTEISKELNIGTDSIVFIDDSEFEINLIKERIPEIYSILVPSKLFEYPKLINEIKDIFYSKSLSKEDKDRLNMYKQNQERQESSNSFNNIDDYLRSLDIKIQIDFKPMGSIDRLVQLTQKTNQFNLTTKRYSISEMMYFLNAENCFVYSFDVSDKFGNSGLTGLCLVKKENEVAVIDTLLMSCRVLGRNIEKVFMYEVLMDLKEKGIKMITGEYRKTPKNAQVENYFENNYFKLESSSDEIKKYSFDYLSDEINNTINYISVSWNKN